MRTRLSPGTPATWSITATHKNNSPTSWPGQPYNTMRIRRPIEHLTRLLLAALLVLSGCALLGGNSMHERPCYDGNLPFHQRTDVQTAHTETAQPSTMCATPESTHDRALTGSRVSDTVGLLDPRSSLLLDTGNAEMARAFTTRGDVNGAASILW
ncbi:MULTISPECIES: hypothetical protein [unclassified Actinobaculum]|uniref:hypothetical protein n=1 Tax=unclassified Actinobaculum TaxID=2609299 RepID=UPI000F742B58|nr:MULTISPECIES: hypothetical protein [unclassified Actinobaculum]RTE49318.1 hypothetical protein EKN07_07060 [Actinobaculum sp. 352]